MIKGTKKPVLEATPDVKASIHNRFDIEVIDAVTGETKQKAYAENIILNQMWTANFWTYAWFKYIHYGTGTAAPSAYDTQLANFYAAVSAGNLTWNYTGDTVWARKSIQLLETVAVDQTIAEVGIGRTATPTTLCTRALLRDMNGNIITIHKTDHDILNIYATVYLHFDLLGYDNGYIHMLPGYLSTADTAPDIISAALGLGKGGSFNVRFGGEGVGYGTTVNTTFVWDGANKVLTGTAARLAAASGNTNSFSGINTANGDLVFNVGGSWFEGSEIVGEPIATGDGETKDFKTTFGAVRTGAKIYVDGVEQVSGVTVDNDLPNNSLWFVRRTDQVRRGAYSVRVDYRRSMSTFDDLVVYLQNPYYPSKGIESIIAATTGSYGGPFYIYGSNDCVNWTDVSGKKTIDAPTTLEVPLAPANRGYKYYCINGQSGYGLDAYFTCGGCKYEHDASGDIHFETAPEEGSVITADYFSKTIAKDEYHVFDLSFTITFGERS